MPYSFLVFISEGVTGLFTECRVIFQGVPIFFVALDEKPELGFGHNKVVVLLHYTDRAVALVHRKRAFRHRNLEADVLTVTAT